MGKYSYGIYVVHVPILTASIALAGKTRLLRWTHLYFVASLGFVALNLVASFAAAFASYHLYEKHFLKLKRNFPEKAAQVAARV